MSIYNFYAFILASVIGYVKTLCDRWQTINKVYVDMSGVGDYIVEDMANAGISEAEGVKFTQETKDGAVA